MPPSSQAAEQRFVKEQREAEVAAVTLNAVRLCVDALISRVVEQHEAVQRARLQQEEREVYVAMATACAEAYKRRYAAALSEAQRIDLAFGPFIDAHSKAAGAWARAFPDEKCLVCRRHAAQCMCLAPCATCGKDVLAHPWLCNGMPPLCRCDRISACLEALGALKIKN